MSMITFVLFYASSSHPERYACGPKCTDAQLAQTRHALGYDEPITTQWRSSPRAWPSGAVPRRPGAPQGRSPARPRVPGSVPGPLDRLRQTIRAWIKNSFPNLAVAGPLGLRGVDGGRREPRDHGGHVQRAGFLDRAIVAASLVAYATSRPSSSACCCSSSSRSVEGAFPTSTRRTPRSRGTRRDYGPPVACCRRSPSRWSTWPATSGAARAFVLETLGEDYIRTARAKGLSKRGNPGPAHAAGGADACW